VLAAILAGFETSLYLLKHGEELIDPVGGTPTKIAGPRHAGEG